MRSRGAGAGSGRWVGARSVRRRGASSVRRRGASSAGRAGSRSDRRRRARAAWATLAALPTFLLAGGTALLDAQTPDRVLVRTLDRGPHGLLPWDEGAVGLRQRLEKLNTTASVLYTASHPDDEQAGVLTWLSRGAGVRTALLTLNRGEGGANAVGPELFDALGMIRTEELRLSGRYYGLDDQYFTTAVDYGFSKTLEEAFRSWDREAVLADMVRVIRINRPLVVISRWHGSARDGHGHHQAAGVLTPAAVEAAADPGRFRGQIRDEGLRPWRVRKLYRGRVRDGEPWHVEVDPGTPSPLLGRSYQELGSLGLSLQRSQTSGRRRAAAGPAPQRFERIGGTGADVESSFFEGLDTSLPGIFSLVGEEAPAAAVAKLVGVEREIRGAVGAFDATDPAPVARHLLAARAGLRDVLAAVPPGSDAAFLLAVELTQVEHALLAALGLEVTARAASRGAAEGTPTGPVVPGRELDVHVSVVNRGAEELLLTSVTLSSPRDWEPAADSARDAVGPGERVGRRVAYQVPGYAVPTRPYYDRGSVAENAYGVADSTVLHLGERRPELSATVTLVVAAAGVPGRSDTLRVTAPVRATEEVAPFGTAERALAVVPRVSVRLTPTWTILRPGAPARIEAEVASHTAEPLDLTVWLTATTGWNERPRQPRLHLEGVGDRARVTFQVEAPAGADTPGRYLAQAHVAGTSWAEGFEEIRHRDLGVRRLYRPARASVVPVDVEAADGLRVAYVMGVGDEVPEAVTALGATVTLLDDEALAAGELDAYNAVVVGTRAYAVRPALVSAQPRLDAYMRAGGHVVVLYQTPEYRPDLVAPYPATLPRRAEEVSEEDAPVRILAPEHPLLSTPNRIAGQDFRGWIEQRGSKFFATWDDAYTPLVETHDTGQAPQRGVWLSAPVGSGHFTYVALALHRQLPYAVPGAYRILANLLSLGRAPAP